MREGVIEFVVSVPKDIVTDPQNDVCYHVRRAAIDLNVPLLTNARLAAAFINAFCTVDVNDLAIQSWDEYK
jgi:carbamoyl-phosphate synthase large subunit